jgi:hypothetical protein
LIGFTGTRSINHCATDGSFFAPSTADAPAPAALARSASAAAGSILMRAMIGGAMITARNDVRVRSAVISSIARTPTLPTLDGSGAPPTPTMRLATTNGMIVIRIAATHSVPTGSTNGMMADRVGEPLPAMPSPIKKPETRATRTFKASDTP